MELTLAKWHTHKSSQEFSRQILETHDGQTALCMFKNQKIWSRSSLFELRLCNWLRDVHICPILWPLSVLENPIEKQGSCAWAGPGYEVIFFSKAHLTLRRHHCVEQNLYAKLNLCSTIVWRSPVSYYPHFFLITIFI